MKENPVASIRVSKIANGEKGRNLQEGVRSSLTTANTARPFANLQLPFP